MPDVELKKKKQRYEMYWDTTKIFSFSKLKVVWDTCLY